MKIKAKMLAKSSPFLSTGSSIVVQRKDGGPWIQSMIGRHRSKTTMEDPTG